MVIPLPLRTLMAFSLISLAFVPVASAEEVCTPAVSWAWECAGTGEGCGVWADGVIGTCTPECVTVECADPTFCYPADKCIPDIPVCVEGSELRGSPGCWADVGTAPCPSYSDKRILYLKVLGWGPSAGCF